MKEKRGTSRAADQRISRNTVWIGSMNSDAKWKADESLDLTWQVSMLAILQIFIHMCKCDIAGDVLFWVLAASSPHR